MSEESESKLYEFLNYYKVIYLIIGLILLAIGGYLGSGGEESTLSFAISHLNLILGEALCVFYLINVVLESETRKTFAEETKKLIDGQEQKLLETLQQTAARVGEQEEKLVKTLNEATEFIKLQEQKLTVVLEDATKTLFVQSQDLASRINHEIFNVVLAERTSLEIAKEMGKTDFFKPGFLFYDYVMNYEFVYNTESNEVQLYQDDEYCVKNFSKMRLDYPMKFSTTEGEYRKYEFMEAGYSTEIRKPQFNLLSKKDFDITHMKGLKEGKLYLLKNEYIQSIEPNGSLKVFTKIKTTFDFNPEGFDDYAFTFLYMMPSVVEVKYPEGFDFHLFPTFPVDRLNVTDRGRNKKRFQLPFLTPGQGYNFSLVKL